MSHGWTTERRARQAQLIRRWQPWTRSTGPRTVEGKTVVSRNAYKGGWRRQSRLFGSLFREQQEVLERIAARFAEIDRSRAKESASKTE